MANARRTRADLIAELESLRARVAALEDDAAALRRSETRYLSALASANAFVVEIDDRGAIRHASPNLASVLGHRPDELSAANRGLDWLHPEDHEEARALFRSLRDGGGSGRGIYRVRHRSGHWLALELVGGAHATRAGERCALILARDVTQRRAREEAMRESESRYRGLAEHASDLISELDEEGRLLFTTANSESILGIPADELIGRPMLDSMQIDRVHPDDREATLEAYRRGIAGEEDLGVEYRFRHADGSWRWLHGKAKTYRTAEGALRFVVITRDVTDKKQSQLAMRKLETRMQHAQKLEGLGVMAGGVAHDFNNLLTPILGDASLALMDLPEDSPVRIRLEKIQKAARRAAELTGQMLAYAGEETLHPERIDLSQMLGETRRLLESAVSRKARLRFDLAHGLPPVHADASQLAQVVMNLVRNASEALDETDGEIRVRTGSARLGSAELAPLVLGSGLDEGSYVILEVSDTGHGMDDATRSRIFDPFFSTKFIGRGLGLAAVLGIVRAHRGCIEIDSAPGDGTRFRVLLPAVASPVARTRPEREPAQTALVGTVLVADDDPGVRELSEETLARAGLKVLSARDGREAVEIFREHRDEIAAVLLDRTMPSRSGEEAFDAIRATRPDVPIILISGYSRASVPTRFANEGLAGFIQKPFVPETLLERLRDLLEK